MPPWERPESMGAGFVGAHVRSTHATAGIATANSALSRVARAIGAMKSGARVLSFLTSWAFLRYFKVRNSVWANRPPPDRKVSRTPRGRGAGRGSRVLPCPAGYVPARLRVPWDVAIISYQPALQLLAPCCKSNITTRRKLATVDSGLPHWPRTMARPTEAPPGRRDRRERARQRGRCCGSLARRTPATIGGLLKVDFKMTFWARPKAPVDCRSPRPL